MLWVAILWSHWAPDWNSIINTTASIHEQVSNRLHKTVSLLCQGDDIAKSLIILLYLFIFPSDVPSGIELQIKFTARKRYVYPDRMRRKVCRGTKVSSKTQGATQHWGDSLPQKVCFLEALCFALAFEICITSRILVAQVALVIMRHSVTCPAPPDVCCLRISCIWRLKCRQILLVLVVASVTQVDELQQPLSWFLFPTYLLTIDAYLCKDPVHREWFQERQTISCFFM